MRSEPAPAVPMERCYTKDVMLRLGMRVWPQMVRELADSGDLIRILTKRNISVKYRQSVLSYLWVVIPPVFAIVLFSYLTSRRIINVGPTPIPYLSYALLNISIWLMFSNALMSATKSLVEAGTLVTRVNFPKITLVIASTGDALLELIIRLMAVAVVFYLQGVNVGLGTLLAPLLLVPLLLLALGIGFLTSILNLVIRDTASLLGIILTLGMFMTPVLYPPPKLEPFVYLNLLNPISPILENIQGLLVYGRLTNGSLLFSSSVFALTVFLIGWRIFNLTMPRINERA